MRMVAVMMITLVKGGFHVLVVEVVAMAVPFLVADKRELNDRSMVSGSVPQAI